MENRAVKYFFSCDIAAIAAELTVWREGPGCEAIIVFIPEAETEHVPALQQMCNDMGITLLGAVFPEVIYAAEFHRQGVLVMGLSTAPHYHLLAGLSKQGSERPVVGGITALFDELPATDESDVVLILLFDAMVANIGSILDRLYLALGDQVHYVGVNAGSETFQPMSCLFDNQRFEQDAVLAIMQPSGQKAVLRHDYQEPDSVIVATSTVGNRIVSIDWQPAFEVYQKLALEKYGVKVTQENFYSLGVHFPFGIIRAENEVLVRIPVALQDDGSLFCVGEVPESAILTLLYAPDLDQVETVGKIVEACAIPSGFSALVFYCAGRRLHFADQAQQELKQLAQGLAPALMHGALSLGEIGSSQQGGYPLFHNATIACCPWGDV